MNCTSESICNFVFLAGSKIMEALPVAGVTIAGQYQNNNLI